jgi:hypothetical protein
VTARPCASDFELRVALVQRMRLRPPLGFLLESLDVGIEFFPVDAPHAAAPELDPGQLSRTNKRVGLRRAHVEIRSNVLKGEQTRLDGRRRLVTFRRICHPSKATTRRRHLPDLPLGSGRLTPLAMFQVRTEE